MDVTKPGGVYIIIYLSQLAWHFSAAGTELILCLPIFLLCFHQGCRSFILTVRRWLLNFQALRLHPRRRGDERMKGKQTAELGQRTGSFLLQGFPRHSAFRHPLTAHSHPLLYKSSSFCTGGGSVGHHENLKIIIYFMYIDVFACMYVCICKARRKRQNP